VNPLKFNQNWIRILKQEKIKNIKSAVSMTNVMFIVVSFTSALQTFLSKKDIYEMYFAFLQQAIICSFLKK